MKSDGSPPPPLQVGLAVDDIKAVQEQASLKRLAMTVQLVLDVESMLPDFVLRRLTVRTMTIYPNQRKKNFIAKLWRGDFAMKEVAEKLMANEEKVGRCQRVPDGCHLSDGGSECQCWERNCQLGNMPRRWYRKGEAK